MTKQRHILVAVAAGLIWVAEGLAADSSAAAKYVENVRNYIESIQTIRFDAGFKGTREQQVEGMEAITYDSVGQYQVAYDEKKAFWKVSIVEDHLPRGKFDADTFSRVHLQEHKTIGKGPERIVEYIHRQKEGGNTATVYDRSSQERDFAMKYLMQEIDPRRYLKLAVPAGRMPTSVEETAEKVLLRYEFDQGRTKVVELSKMYNYLPVKAYNEGQAWLAYKGGAYVSAQMAFDYDMTPQGPVVSRLSYTFARGQGVVQYTNVEYNVDIDESEFDVDIPADAWIYDAKLGVMLSNPPGGPSVVVQAGPATGPARRGAPAAVGAAHGPAAAPGAVGQPPAAAATVVADASEAQDRRTAAPNRALLWAVIAVVAVGLGAGIVLRRRGRP